MKILGIAASRRNRFYGELKDVMACKNEEELLDFIEKVSRKREMSNSEAGTLAALWGAKDIAEVEFLSLSEYFIPIEPADIPRKKELIDKIKSADGIIIGSPSYFGDRSSYVQSLFNLDPSIFKGKVVGGITSAAKRNGGLETVNLYLMYDAISKGAYACGDGPSVCQFGGALHAGDIGTAAIDNYGINSCIRTGRRVSNIVKILNAKPKHKKIIIDVWITKDNKGIVKKELKQMKKLSGVKFNILDLTEYSYNRCLACTICPNPAKTDQDYKCTIDYDIMKELHPSLLRADGVIIAGTDNAKIDVYQVFLERTRYIRRDSFRLKNKTVTSYLVGPEKPSLFPLKVITSFVRHNMILTPPMIVGGTKKEKAAQLREFAKHTKFIAQRSYVDATEDKYKPVGYGKHKNAKTG